MPDPKRHKDEHRYYLLPGMGRSNKRWRAQILRWSLIFGVIVSVLFALLLYLLNRRGP